MKIPERQVGRLNRRGRDCLHSVPRTPSKLWKKIQWYFVPEWKVSDVPPRREIIVRGQSYFSRLPKYWPPPIPLSARRVCTPAFIAGGGQTRLPLENASIRWWFVTLEWCVPWTTCPLDGGSIERRGSFKMRPLVDASLTNVCTEISWRESNFFFTTHSVCGQKPKTIEIRGQLRKMKFFPVPKSQTQMGIRFVQKTLGNL
jgi:hypothetical protein